jgi:Ase1/PRC1/MAP65 family protein
MMASPPQGVSFSASVLSPGPQNSSLNSTFIQTKHPTVTNSSTSNNLNATNANQSTTSAFTPVRPVLTPSQHTPRGSLGLVLLSPSRTITESLNALASSTAQQLERIWDKVGYTPEERASQLSDLLQKFRDQCEQKIQEEQGVADTFRQTIADSKEEIRKLASALKVTIDPELVLLLPPGSDNGNNGDSSIDGHFGMTLTEELANIETTVERLREDASIAREDLEGCLDYLIESHQALGVPLDTKWNDIESDLTLLRRKSFHAKVDEMKQEVSTRTSAVIQLLRDCQHLMNDLGMDPNQDGNSSTLDRRIAGSLVRSKDSTFIMASKFETDTCTGIGANALETLTTRATELSQEKRRRKSLLQDMGQEIAMLWEQLRIPEEEQKAFTESVKGIGMDTIDKGRVELDRLKALKSSMLGKLVGEARDTIRQLWDETNATLEQRRSFEAMNVRDDNLFDDELLDQHDEYIRVLMDRLESMKPIIRIIDRREDILRERMEYEELQKDSDRLKQRGSAMAKQLMEEERMARRIKRDLPKLTKHLQEKLGEWKQSHGEDFVFNGEVYELVMARQEQEWQEYKQNEMQLKLRKKQDDQVLEENRYLGKTSNGFKVTASTRQVLGDAAKQVQNNSLSTRTSSNSLGITKSGKMRSGRNGSDQKVLRS